MICSDGGKEPAGDTRSRVPGGTVAQSPMAAGCKRPCARVQTSDVRELLRVKADVHPLRFLILSITIKELIDKIGL